MDFTKILSPRLAEILQADKEGRVVILPTQAQAQRFVVEKALDIKLHDWQVAYIWGGSHYLMPGRATGKTLAQIIKLCVSEGAPVMMLGNSITISGYGVPDHYPNYKWYRSEVKRIYRAFQMYDVPGLRKIYFSYQEAEEDGFHCWRV